MSAAKLVALVRDAGQDFEFYPTTEEIIAAMVRDIRRGADRYHHRSLDSVLDVGAGSGKVLLALRDRADFKTLHAIEKSTPLIEQMDPDILIVGTEFAEQSLLSKHVDVIFSNPPYSVFEQWAEKIIRQAASEIIYLVIPIRWKDSVAIADALRYREAEIKTVGSFDFENAEDRQARAKVNLLRVTLKQDHRRDGDDAFERFFNEQFADLIGKFDATKTDEKDADQREEFKSLVIGPSFIESLVAIYDAEVAKVQHNCVLVSGLDARMLKEFGVEPTKIMECLREKLSGLRSLYWSELFSRLNTVTDRLTSGSRRRLLDTLHKHVHVDFTASNIYAVMIWVIKNANLYLDQQLIDTYELMVDKCNVQMYKSNQRTWQDNHWRYNDTTDKNTHFALDYRIVTHRLGGIRSGYSFERGLDERAAHFIGDLLTLATNLGFQSNTAPSSLMQRESWTSGEKVEFWGKDKRTGDGITIFDVRAFKNGNLHLRLHKSFILALNVEHGRLQGWLRSRDQAVEELGDTEAAEYFNSNLRLGANPMLLLGAPTNDMREAA